MSRRTVDLAAVLAVEERHTLLLELLARGTRSVNELVTETGITQPQVSKHLDQLEKVGLVRRSGGKNSVPQPAVVLGLLEQLNGAARSGLIAQLEELRTLLEEEESRAAALGAARSRLADDRSDGAQATDAR